MTTRTLAGQSKHLERAVVVAFYRGAEGLGLPRRSARHGVERAERFFQRLGAVYIAVVVPFVVIVMVAAVLARS